MISDLLHKTSRRTLALAALPVIMLGTVLTASAASAAPSGVAEAPVIASGIHICETFGDHLCIGAPDLALDKPVKETFSGRDLDIVQFKGFVQIQFTANRSLCVAAADNGYLAVIHHCNGGSGVDWHNDGSPGKRILVNAKFSPKELAGRNLPGSQYHVKNSGAAGWDYKFKES